MKTFLEKPNVTANNNVPMPSDSSLCDRNAGIVPITDRYGSTANKYYSSASHHEQKNKKTSGQIKFLLVLIKQEIKLVLQHSLC